MIALRWLFVSLALIGSAAARAEDRCVQVREERAGDRFTLVAQLEGCVEATITLTAELSNMTASVGLPLTVDTAGRDRVVLAVFEPRDAKARWTWRWHQDWKVGRRSAGAPAAHLYELPYKDGPHEVSQGPHGTFSHGVGSQDEDAIDWKMPMGTRIFPARPGTVVALRRDVTEGGPDLK